MNAAIEAAARALDPNAWLSDDAHMLSRRALARRTATAAIIAFLRNCEVSDDVMSAGGNIVFDCCDINPSELVAAFKAMAAQQATELEGK